MMEDDGITQALDGPLKIKTGERNDASLISRPGFGVQNGVATVDSLDAMTTELDATYVDPLDALITELERIEAHESMLRDAVANNKPVVVHPRKEALVPPRAPNTPATPQEFIVQGGLASFEIDQDLLNKDFSHPDQAPGDFRIMSYNPERITLLASGISGSFGKIDPKLQGMASFALQDYLRRIQQQAEQVKILIDGRSHLSPSKATSHAIVQEMAVA